MSNSLLLSTFFDQVKTSISEGTFAKLTLAKTMGNPDLKNIYVRTTVLKDEIGLSVTYRFQTEEEIHIYTVEEAFIALTPYINNPFLSALLFTTKADVVFKLNKKRVGSIVEKPPTFKNPDLTLLAFNSK